MITAITSLLLQEPWWLQPKRRWLNNQGWEQKGHGINQPQGMTTIRRWHNPKVRYHSEQDSTQNSIYKPRGITIRRCHHTTVRYHSEQESDRTSDTIKTPTQTSATRKIHTMTPNIRNTQAKTTATNKTPPRTSAPIINLPHKETWWLQPTGRWLNIQGWEQQSHPIK